MRYRQLSKNEFVDEKQITKLGELLYQTDQYIFPCICNEKDSYLLGKLCLSGVDEIFSLSNCFVAEDEKNGEICGVILWHKGPVQWDAASLQRLASEENLSLSHKLQSVREEYFHEYSKVPPNTISIMNVCVDKDYRSAGVGFNMLSQFVMMHVDTSLELYVLEKNTIAISLYNKVGFIKEAGDSPAFTPNNDPSIRCFKMVYSMES